MNGAIANPNDPRLSIGDSLIQLSGSSHRINIDRYNLAMIAFFDLGTNLSFIDCVASLGKLLLTITGLSNHHTFAPKRRDLSPYSSVRKPTFLDWAGNAQSV
jgi:hypothetical protein